MVGHLGWGGPFNFPAYKRRSLCYSTSDAGLIYTALRNYSAISGLCRLLLIMLSVRAPYCLGVHSAVRISQSFVCASFMSYLLRTIILLPASLADQTARQTKEASITM